MKQIIMNWFHRYFSEPEAISLILGFILAIILFIFIGHAIIPIIASIIIAYILNGFVLRLQKWHISHLTAVIIVCSIFVGLLVVALGWLFPLIFQQSVHLLSDIPKLLERAQAFLLELQARHPTLFTVEQLKYFTTEFSQYLTKFGQFILSISLSYITNIITTIVYLILVPLMVFFFLKDKTIILNWFSQFLPKKHQVITEIWQEVDVKINDYIRGKLIEIIIITLVCELVFFPMQLNYALLLSFCVGLSTIIPYIGAVLVSIPIVAVAYFQWGFTSHFVYLIIIYAVILTVDANILVPLLFSERMKLHPVAIILALLIFGSLFGFWGVFFAIPLATIVDALLKRWPRKL